MAVFKVGDRVRVRCPGCRHDGKETVVLAINVPGYDWIGQPTLGVTVDLPRWTNGHDHATYDPRMLEPILYDGNTLVTWESIEHLWQRPVEVV